MKIYKVRKDIDPDVFDDVYDIDEIRWTPADIKADSIDFGITPEEFIEAYLEEDTEARFWLDFGPSTDYDTPFELKLVGWNDTVWYGTFADAGISEADVEAERAIGMLDDFFQKELGIAPDDWEIG